MSFSEANKLLEKIQALCKNVQRPPTMPCIQPARSLFYSGPEPQDVFVCLVTFKFIVDCYLNRTSKNFMPILFKQYS